MFIGRTTDERRAEGDKKECLCPLSWSAHDNFAGYVYIESTSVAVSKQDIRHGNKKLFPVL